MNLVSKGPGFKSHQLIKLTRVETDRSQHQRTHPVSETRSETSNGSESGRKIRQRITQRKIRRRQDNEKSVETENQDPESVRNLRIRADHVSGENLGPGVDRNSARFQRLGQRPAPSGV